MGTLVLPREVGRQAEERSVLINFTTPRRIVLDMIRQTYPGIEPSNIHVWTLGGKSREKRIGGIWKEWRDLGVNIVEDGWELPTGMPSFNDSGTYAPTFLVGLRKDGAGTPHLFLADGYAASAEAIQAASLDPVLDLHTSLCIFSSRFDVSCERERHVMGLDPDSSDFAAVLAEALGKKVTDSEMDEYREIIRNARDAGMPLHRRTVEVDDFFPNKRWRVLAVAGYMLPDPYTGAPGVEKVNEDTYRVTTRFATRMGIREVTLTLRLMESFEESRLVFSPLLDRFYAGHEYKRRAVKISDSGRIRNELQTLISTGLEYFGEDGVRVHFDRIDDAVLPPDKKKLIRDVLAWYKKNHPIWFRWLEVA
jgi:hypothetical protein